MSTIIDTRPVPGAERAETVGTWSGKASSAWSSTTIGRLARFRCAVRSPISTV